MIFWRHILKLCVFVVVVQFLSCGGGRGGPKCWGENKNKGIINSELLIPCPPRDFIKNYIIDSDSAYHNAFDQSCVLPSIDFSKETLLGIFTTNSGCKQKITREVTVHKTEPRYIYEVVIKNCGFCAHFGDFNMNWVRVPRLPKDWTVTFTLKEN